MPNPWLVASALALVVLLPRALLFSFNENLYGDAVVRTELGLRWLNRPHWIASFKDGAYQFGPLHLYLLGLSLKLVPEREHAGRLLSLVLATVSTFPLHFLARRLFDWRAGVVACLGLAAWGIHIQMSDTAGSEALSLLLSLWLFAAVARLIDEGRLGDLFGAALLTNLLCATRYDAWMLLPFCMAAISVATPDRVAGTTRAVLYGFLSSPFILIWLDGNEHDTGSAFFPLRYIDEFHRNWVVGEAARLGELLHRVYALLFWPGVALLTLGPLLVAFGVRGMVRSWRAGQHRWLILFALLPTAYFAFRGAVTMTFVPLARFAVGQVALLLPFAWRGAEDLRFRKALLTAALASTAVLTGAFGLMTFGKQDVWADALRPVSPVSNNPPALMFVAGRLKSEPAPATVLLERDPQFRDLQIAFFSGLPETRLIRQRWPEHTEQLAAGRPELIVRIEGGELSTLPGFGLSAHAGEILLHGERYAREAGTEPPYSLFRLMR